MSMQLSPQIVEQAAGWFAELRGIRARGILALAPAITSTRPGVCGEGLCGPLLDCPNAGTPPRHSASSPQMTLAVRIDVASVLEPTGPVASGTAASSTPEPAGCQYLPKTGCC